MLGANNEWNSIAEIPQCHIPVERLLEIESMMELKGLMTRSLAKFLKDNYDFLFKQISGVFTQGQIAQGLVNLIN